MTKLDLTRQYKAYYTANTKPALTEIEPARYLSISGTGAPSLPASTDRIQALYTSANVIQLAVEAEDHFAGTAEIVCHRRIGVASAGTSKNT